MPIEIEGLGPILKKIEALGKPAIYKTPMKQSMVYLEDKLKVRVVKSPGAFTALATAGQRKAYWAKVSSGQAIQGPQGYKRTGATARAWKWRISTSGTGVTGKIGNIKPGAAYVYGSPENRPLSQQPFHARSGWPRVDLVMKKAEKTIVGYFQKALERALKK